MKTEKEIEKMLIDLEKYYVEAVKCEYKYLQAVGSGAINALRSVLEIEPFDFEEFKRKVRND